MNVLDLVVTEMAGKGGPEHTGMAKAVLEMLGSQGGLDAVAQSFQQKGLGEVVGSWIGTGANQPVSPDQVAGALGSDQVGSLAQKTGLSPALASSILATVLPIVVDKLTPHGQVPPPGSLLQAGMGMLAKKLL